MLFMYQAPDDEATGADSATATAEKPKKVNSKFISGTIDTQQLTPDQLDQLCSLFIRGYNPVALTTIGKQLELAKRLKREEVFSLEDIDKALEKKRAESLADIPPEYLALSKDELVDLTERAGMRINWDLYSDASLWKVAKRLSNRAKKLNDGAGVTLDQLRVIPKPEGRTTRVPILFPDINAIPTTAPEGVDEFTKELLQALRESPKYQGATFQVGRSKGKRANALIRIDGRNIVIGLSQDYALETEEEEENKTTAEATA